MEQNGNIFVVYFAVWTFCVIFANEKPINLLNTKTNG